MSSGPDEKPKDPAGGGDKLTPPPKEPLFDRFIFFKHIKSLLAAFPKASTGQQALILAMGLGAAMFIGLGLVGSFTIGAWALVTMFSLAIILIFVAAGMLFVVEQRVRAPLRCRHVPFPPDAGTIGAIKPALEEIRKDFFEQLVKSDPALQDDRIRANIFLLQHIEGGASDGAWMLVIHRDFAINMNHLPELDLQLQIGRGATGVAYRDGTYQLTRRLPDPTKGDWDQKFQMTPALSEQIHKNLQWIFSFPLLRPGTNEAIGVLNIDSLAKFDDDQKLNVIASSVRRKVEDIARHLSLQRSDCIGLDKLGILNHV
jgi:hypothetical protein